MNAKGIKTSQLFTLEEKPVECEDYVNENVFVIDFDEKAVRVGRNLNLIAGDIQEGSIITKYELGKNAKGKYQSKVSRDILFIERNVNFLKTCGRMAIVLPQGRFNNSSDKYIRDFIAERCRILAVVGVEKKLFEYPALGNFAKKMSVDLSAQIF